MKRMLCAWLLGLSVLTAASSAKAQIIDLGPCNGYEIGWFCWFITQGNEDAVLDCMDCVDPNCDWGCPRTPMAGSFEAYRRCILIAYATCFGDFVTSP